MNETRMTIVEVMRYTRWIRKKINLFTKHGYLKWGEDKKVSFDSVITLVNYLEKISTEYITFRKFLVDILGINYKTNCEPIKKKLKHIIEFLELPFCINMHRTFVSNASVEKYSQMISESGNFIKFEEAWHIFDVIKKDCRVMSLYSGVNVYPYKGNNYLNMNEIEEISKRINKSEYGMILAQQEEKQRHEMVNIIKNNELGESNEFGKSLIDNKGIIELFNSSVERVRVAIKKGIFGEVIFENSRTFYKVSNVKQVYDSAKHILNNYYTSQDIRILFGRSYLQKPKIRSIKVPFEVWLFNKTQSSRSLLYLKRDVDDFIIQKTAPSDPQEYFLFFYTKNNIVSKTKELYQVFSETKISQSNAAKDNVMKLTYELLQVAKKMEELKKELFLFDNNEIISLMESFSIKVLKHKLYQFLKFLLQQRICKFDINRINNPRPKERKVSLSNDEDEIFTFDELKDIYNYATDIKIHIKSSTENNSYSSTWLFILLHLSNAWRLGDIVNTPKIFPEDIGITDMDYFMKGNVITLAQGQTIINQLRHFELRISKTNIKRSFYCNIDLVIPLATAMCITELNRRKLEYYSDRLINFHTRKNYPSDLDIKKFFYSSDKCRNLKFGNRKMNKSILTHLYYSIQHNIGESNSAFMIVAKLRDHQSDITKKYISQTSEIGEVTKALFNRGEFGYLYDALLNIISSKDKSFIERTTTIQEVRELVSPKLLEIVVGYIQAIETDNFSLATPMARGISYEEYDMGQGRKDILESIKQLDPSEAFELVRKIYLRQLPSREQHIQCFTYPDCFRESNLFDCKTCKYSIPNYMAIGAIFDELVVKINRFKKVETIGSRRKEEKQLKNLMSSISYAIHTFGEDFVWSFIEGGEEGFEEQLNKL